MHTPKSSKNRNLCVKLCKIICVLLTLFIYGLISLLWVIFLVVSPLKNCEDATPVLTVQKKAKVPFDYMTRLAGMLEASSFF